MIKKWSITIPELTGKQKRNAYIYVPDEFKRNPDARYPVLYMFDGHNVFFDEDATYGKSWGMKDFMDYTQLPLIIAAVECNHNPNNGRLCEYSPFTFRVPELGYIRGRGRTTMEWMTKVFKPEIDRRYPTLPHRDFTFIAGSSMGGLMSLYALIQYNHVFSRAAALSPSLWVAPDKLTALIRSARLDPNTVLYMDYGANELSNHDDMLRLFSRTASELLIRRVLLNCRIVPDGDHCEASWERQIPFFMNTLLYGIEQSTGGVSHGDTVL